MTYSTAPLPGRAARLVLVLAWVLAAGFGGWAQGLPRPVAVMGLMGDNPTTLAYTGPRFAAGPDSLRAALRRLARQVPPDWAGQPVFLRLQLDSAGHPRQAYFLAPAGSASARYQAPEAQALARRLAQQLPTWQTAGPTPGHTFASLNAVVLPLAPGPLPYSDQNPTFAAEPAANRGPQAGPVPNLTMFLQMQLRNGGAPALQPLGPVYVYFEVSETGAVEQCRVVGSAGPTLDAEALHALQLLPPARTPPTEQGRPVRVGYVLPLTFQLL